MFIDYAKAFDHVDHSIVIHKLIAIGVSPVLVRWIGSFLCHRQQRAEYVSEWLTLKVACLKAPTWARLYFW